MENNNTHPEKAYFASGCFWGTEYHFAKAVGVIETTVGFTGGHKPNPTYNEVYTDTTGHAETVEVVFDPSKTSYESLVKLFFETHDFTQTDGQGPDTGDRYRSAIFYVDDKQKETAEKYIEILTDKGRKPATKIEEIRAFWPAEEYHQDYYEKTGGNPYCHIYEKIF